MLVLQGSNAITSIILGLLFSAVPRVVADAADAADAGFCDYSNINEPIGIDLGYQYITASYANSSTIFTPLAVVNNAEYIALVSQLAAEHYEYTNYNRLFGDRDRSMYGTLKLIISHLTSKLTAKIPYIDHPYVELITSTTSQIYASLASVATRFRRLIGTSQRPNALTLSDVSETFIRVFHDLKASTIADTGTKLSFALIGIPDFFNETLADIVVDASRKAGIDTTAHVLPRSMLTHFENPAVREGATVLVLHQGMDHCGSRIYFEGGSQSSSRRASRRRAARKKKNGGLGARDIYLRFDPWRGETMYRRLTGTVIRSDPEVKAQLELGADRDVLYASVVQARLRLKKQDWSVAHLGTESRSADFYTTIEENSDEYLEEVPLELDDWWVYGKDRVVKLTKEMVLAADEEYVKALAKMIHTFVAANEGITISPEPMFDQVAILTDGVDGDLVRRAVKQALGDDIPIMGGSLSNVTMAADGAARLALIRRRNLLKMRGEQPLFGHDEL